MLFNNEQVMVSAWIQLFILFKSNDNKRGGMTEIAFQNSEGKFKKKLIERFKLLLYPLFFLKY